MGADIGDGAAVQDQDAVGAAHRGDTLGNDDLCGIGPRRLQRLIEICLCPQVERAGRIVKDQDLGRLEDGAGNAQALFLAAGKAHAALGHQRVIAVGRLFDKIRGRGRGPRLPAFPRRIAAPRQC